MDPELRHCPDLSGLPPVKTWSMLTNVIGWNVEESAGKRLRAELEQLGKARTWGIASVTQLRSAEWFRKGSTEREDAGGAVAQLGAGRRSKVSSE